MYVFIILDLFAFPGNLDHYNFLIPVMKALIEKCTDLLNLTTYLPNLPSTQTSPTFYDDFKDYCLQDEWRSFMRKQVYTVYYMFL